MNVAGDEAVAALHARVVNADALPREFAVCTDTRTLQKGDAFVALRGERFDGHAFTAQAVAAGAAALIVAASHADDKNSAALGDAGVPLLVVDDTTAAYLALGALARRRSVARVVALTGSTGKTTTRALLAQLLERIAPGRVAATAANENNEIGVAKSLLAIPDDAAYAVVELGARRYGEIEPLARAVAPDVAVLTNVGDAHLEIMGSRERLAETKWAIFATGAQAVLNLADAASCARAAHLPALPTWFGLDSEADAAHGTAHPGRACIVLHGRALLEVRDASGTRTYPCCVDVPGEHNRRNAVAAFAAAHALGVDAAQAATALASAVLPPGRYERVQLACGEAIYDAYNASAEGTLATLQSFGAEPAGRRIGVLSSMAELGPESPAMHANVGAAAARAGLDALLVGGQYAADLAHGARSAGYDAARIVPFADNAGAVDWLRRNLRAGDLVLFKGSRRYRLEEIVAALQPSAHGLMHA